MPPRMSMNSLDAFLTVLDPFLIAPYRLFSAPIPAWWFGTIVLAAECLLLGELTLAVTRRLNRDPIALHGDEAKHYQEQSMDALRSGDKESYKAINKLANESFGRSFFLSAATGMGSLWPLFFAAGWMDMRFGGLKIPLFGLGVGWPAGLLLCYIAVRLAYRRGLLPRLRRRVDASEPATGAGSD